MDCTVLTPVMTCRVLRVMQLHQGWEVQEWLFAACNTVLLPFQHAAGRGTVFAPRSAAHLAVPCCAVLLFDSQVWGVCEAPVPRMTLPVRANVCSIKFSPSAPHMLAAGNAGHQASTA